MTKEQWQQTVRVMKLKWPNFNWSNDQIKSAYDSLKEIDVKYIEKSIEQSFKSGADFPPNASNIYATAMEIQRYEWNDQKMAGLDAPQGTLHDYLLANDYESVAHAMYESAKSRYDTNTQEVYEIGKFDYSQDWEEAKSTYAENMSGFLTKLFIEEVEDGVSK